MEIRPVPVSGAGAVVVWAAAIAGTISKVAKAALRAGLCHRVKILGVIRSAFRSKSVSKEDVED